MEAAKINKSKVNNSLIVKTRAQTLRKNLENTSLKSPACQETGKI